MVSFRTFLAVPLPETLQRSIGTLQQELSTGVSGVRWVSPANLHLTLHFFGEVRQEDLEKIKVSMISVKRIQGASSVEVKGLGAFPDLRRPRVLWLALTPTPLLEGLFRSCQAALEQVGFTPERRPFAPHLTIGRIRHQRQDLRAMAAGLEDRQVGTLPIRALVLYESRLHRNGAEHLPIYTVDLINRLGDTKSDQKFVN